MDSKRDNVPDTRGQAGPSPALSGASPAPMELELQEAELHQFTAEEDRLIDMELGVEIVEEEEKEEMCEEERRMKRKWAREDAREDKKEAKRRKIAEEEDVEKALPDRIGAMGKDKGGQSEMSRETTARMVESRLKDRRSGTNPTLGNDWSGSGASWEGAAGRLGTSVAQWDAVRSKKRRELRRIEEGKFKGKMARYGAKRRAEKMEKLRKEKAGTAAEPSGSTTTPPGHRRGPRATPRMNLAEEVERMQAPAKKTSRTMFSGAPQDQQQQQQPPQGNGRTAAIIDYETMMRKQEAELSRLKKGLNSYKVAVGKIRAECGKMAAEATRRAKEEKKRGEEDIRPALQEKKMRKRIEIEVRKKE